MPASFFREGQFQIRTKVYVMWRWTAFSGAFINERRRSLGAERARRTGERERGWYGLSNARVEWRGKDDGGAAVYPLRVKTNLLMLYGVRRFSSRTMGGG